jgi:hypothetical protein
MNKLYHTKKNKKLIGRFTKKNNNGKNQIIYLGHRTNINNLGRILETGNLYTAFERKYYDIKYEGILSSTNDKIFKNKNKISMEYFKFEYPGIYMSYYSNDIIKNKKPYDIEIMFGVELLEQKNYHLNLIDHNGYIMENLTFSDYNIDKLPNLGRVNNFYKSDGYNNEIIFHDKININLITKIYCSNKENYDNVINLINANDKINKNYTNIVELHYKYPTAKLHISNDKLSYIDKNILPCFVFYSGLGYSGIKQAYYPHKNKFNSSLEFCKQIARVANVSDDILKKIKTPKDMEKYMETHKLYDYYFHNRDKQNFTEMQKLFNFSK